MAGMPLRAPAWRSAGVGAAGLFATLGSVPGAGAAAAGSGACPATCYKNTCDHWVEGLGHSCAALEQTDLCDCSGCECRKRGTASAGLGAPRQMNDQEDLAGAGSSTTSGDLFNCIDGVANWRVGWSIAKQRWCCGNKGLGCQTAAAELPSSAMPTFDCLTNVGDWKHHWSQEKQDVCCSTYGLGCAATQASESTPATSTRIASATPSGSTPTSTTTRPDTTSASSRAPATTASATTRSRTGTDTTITSATSSGTTTTSTAKTSEDAGTAFDCLASLRDWQSTWPKEQSQWCCAVEGLGCPPTQDTELHEQDFNCLDGLPNWRAGWSEHKKISCCRHEGLGCPTIAIPFDEGGREYECLVDVEGREKLWPAEKKSWCCTYEGLGCQQTLAFDCLESVRYWQRDWSGPKKQWCCGYMGLGCQPFLAAADASKHDGATEAAGKLPAWWLLLGIVPEEGSRAFSKEQRHTFGIDSSGEVLDSERFALAAQATAATLYSGLPGSPNDPAPWWYLFGVQPAGYAKRQGKCQNVTFSPQQQKYFGIDERGTRIDQAKFDEASKKLRAAHAGTHGVEDKLPSWWILGGVVPEGGGMGRPLAFSERQQDRFGVSCSGSIVDRLKFDVAMLARSAPAVAADASNGNTPWWVALGVQPVSFEREGDAFVNASFSKPQQDAFGVDADGNPVDRLRFEGLLRALHLTGEATSPERLALPAWWVRRGVVPRGWTKRAGRLPEPLFSVEQEAYFGVDQRGVVVNRTRFTSATGAEAALHGDPWWILLGVQPKGLGHSETQVSFSELQQERFGVDSNGRVVEQERFDAAAHALRAAGVLGPDPQADELPWWVIHNVLPESFRRDSGRMLQVTFSAKQQSEFAVTASGKVASAPEHLIALRMLKQSKSDHLSKMQLVSSQRDQDNAGSHAGRPQAPSSHANRTVEASGANETTRPESGNASVLVHVRQESAVASSSCFGGCKETPKGRNVSGTGAAGSATADPAGAVTGATTTVPAEPGTTEEALEPAPAASTHVATTTALEQAATTEEVATSGAPSPGVASKGPNIRATKSPAETTATQETTQTTFLFVGSVNNGELFHSTAEPTTTFVAVESSTELPASGETLHPSSVDVTTTAGAAESSTELLASGHFGTWSSSTTAAEPESTTATGAASVTAEAKSSDTGQGEDVEASMKEAGPEDDKAGSEEADEGEESGEEASVKEAAVDAGEDEVEVDVSALDEGSTLKMLEALRNAERMHDHALAELGFPGTPAAPVHPRLRGFDPERLGVESAEKARAPADADAESTAGLVGGPAANWTEEASKWLRDIEHKLFVKSACSTATAAFRQKQRAAWLARVKVLCTDRFAEHPQSDACFVAGALEIAAADPEVGKLLGRRCENRTSVGRSDGSVNLAAVAEGMFGGGRAVGPWKESEQLLSNFSGQLYKDSVDVALDAGRRATILAAVPGAPEVEVTSKDRAAVGTILCASAVEEEVWAAVSSKAAELARECRAAVAALAHTRTSLQASNTCMEAGFSELFRVGSRARDCRTMACSSHVNSSALKGNGLAVDAHEAAVAFQADARASPLGGCSEPEGDLTSWLDLAVANATAWGAAALRERLPKAEAEKGDHADIRFLSDATEFKQKPMDRFDVACKSAADAMQVGQRAAWIAHVKARCDELAESQALHNLCFSAGAAAIHRADGEVAQLAERSCSQQDPPTMPDDMLSMADSLAGESWTLPDDIRNKSNSMYREAVEASAQSRPAVLSNQEAVATVASLFCQDALRENVTTAVQFKTGQLASACGKLALGAATKVLGIRATRVCSEVGFATLLRISGQVRSCYSGACRKYVAGAPAELLAADTYEAVQRFKAARSFPLPAGCGALARFSDAGEAGGLEVLLAEAVANATSQGAAVLGEAHSNMSRLHETRYLSDKFLFPAAGVVDSAGPEGGYSAAAASLAGVLAVFFVAFWAVPKLLKRTRRRAAAPGSSSWPSSQSDQLLVESGDAHGQSAAQAPWHPSQPLLAE